MKNIIALCIFFGTAFMAFGQVAPSSINYQSILRNSNGSALPNQNVSVRFSVLQGSTLGTYVFQEEHSVTTTDIGLINLKIGQGLSSLNSLSTIDWSQGPYFIQVEVDTTSTGSYSSYGSSQISSVPYSLYSSFSAVTDSLSPKALSNLPQFTLSNDSLFVGNLDTLVIPFSQFNLTEFQVDSMVSNNGYLLTEKDSSIVNEIQELQLSGDSLKLSLIGTGVDLTKYLDNTVLSETDVDSYVSNNGYLTSEVDGSVTNEIQDLQLNSNNLIITNNTNPTSIDLSPYLDNTVLSETDVDSYVSNNGYLTSEVDGSVTNEIQDLKQVLTQDNDADNQSIFNIRRQSIGQSTLDTSAVLDVNSTTQGFLPPRMTQAQRDAIYLPAAGLIIWCTDCGTNGLISAYNGSGWADLQLTNTAGAVPTVTTDAVTSYGVTSATLGGNILSNGGSTIIARGICYSSSPNPNITDNITNVTTGTGAFSEFVIGLDSNTTIYARAYATNSNGIAYGNQIQFTTKGLVSIGDFYQGGRVFYILQGGDKDYVPGEQHGLIALPFDYYASLPWMTCTNSSITGATSQYIGEGDINTNAIVASCPSSTNDYAALIAQNSTSYGYSDWYLPNLGELLKALQANTSAGLNLSGSYWSSTKYNSAEAMCARKQSSINTYREPYGTQNKIRLIRKF